jgi:hypothetical protein
MWASKATQVPTCLEQVRIDGGCWQDLVALVNLARPDADAAETAGERLDAEDELDPAHAVGLPAGEGVGS